MKKIKSSNGNHILRASEVGHYTYCSLAWYLQRSGHIPKSPYFEEGRQAHNHLGETLQSVQQNEKTARWFILLGALAIIFAVLVLLIGVILS